MSLVRDYALTELIVQETTKIIIPNMIDLHLRERREINLKYSNSIKFHSNRLKTLQIIRERLIRFSYLNLLLCFLNPK